MTSATMLLRLLAIVLGCLLLAIGLLLSTPGLLMTGAGASLSWPWIKAWLASSSAAATAEEIVQAKADTEAASQAFERVRHAKAVKVARTSTTWMN
jgi:hypothetical protein